MSTEAATKSKNDEQQAATATIKQLRAQDAASAMREYQQERLVVLAGTERLRALRLSRDSQASNNQASNARKQRNSSEQRTSKSSR
jgi:hypothetical protein